MTNQLEASKPDKALSASSNSKNWDGGKGIGDIEAHH
jgi:hypothetical protein